MQIPNYHDLPIDFPRAGDDVIEDFLRWQACICAGHHVANMCFDAKYESAVGQNNDGLLARSVFLVCDESFTHEEVCWIAKHSAAQLGW